MDFNLCTISFRHELVSFEELMEFAVKAGFTGIELWSVHGKAMLNREGERLLQMVRRLRSYHLHVPMVSDYIDLSAGSSAYGEHLKSFQQSIDLACMFDAGLIRLFAGNKASLQVDRFERELWIDRLGELTERAGRRGIGLAIETHPKTMADTLQSTLDLIRDIHHPQLTVNLDFLHLWESGSHPIEAFRELQPFVSIMHLKNISAKQHLGVFEPGNVYSPNGSREGIVALGEGLVDYKQVISCLMEQNLHVSASLEWFGRNPYEALSKDIGWLKHAEAGQTV
ncbi:3-dehydroshikimate dehydratase [Fontibacillus phaseoli]|uniref:3-dehydroshikimate dehydratase n=1 Tax=Fontibacillus phaseoli TaxID=1416533 RepID=A0A369B7C7_9BACL|nr:sugar phosphate isomerase/epimerase family protein [Fontibacillus phaseoli]RCX17331.1 3-dehydroshikimate dehydratase [Fontibacillus phaseoli]